MKIHKIFYLENKETHVATGAILSEDSDFISIHDRFEGELRIGKKFITKIKEVLDDGHK